VPALPDGQFIQDSYIGEARPHGLTGATFPLMAESEA
jgi:hypothetical protein